MIIFLNGCSSSGKTTIAKALQQLSDKPWLHLGIDTFFQMMPAKYVGFGEKANLGFHFIPESDEEGPLMRIETGSFGKAVSQSCPKVVKVLANDGHHLIVDEVLFDDSELGRYVEALDGHTVYFIGILCDLKTMQERELLRGNRALGLGRDQISRVHGLSRGYDFTIDTTKSTPFECAQQILDYIRKTLEPKGFKAEGVKTEKPRPS